MSTLRSWAVRFAAALVLANGLAAPALAEKVLRIANMGEPETLDPHKTSTVIEANILRNLFEGLVVQDPKGNVAPGVAERWSVSPDGLTYTFHLRRKCQMVERRGRDGR
jgi:oligopeptide transport system substrate-binding protein